MGCHFLFQCMKGKSESEVAQSCPTLSDPMDYSPPGSSIRGIFQARLLEWVAIAISGNARDLGSNPGSGRSPGEGNGNPLQYSCLENHMDGGAWWAIVHWVAKSQTQLRDFKRCVLKRNTIEKQFLNSCNILKSASKRLSSHLSPGKLPKKSTGGPEV